MYKDTEKRPPTTDRLLKEQATPEEFAKAKKTWAVGPWNEEKDYERLIVDGYDCIIRRVVVYDRGDGKTPLSYFGGHLCGYVILPEKITVDEDFLYHEVEVHGGITLDEKLADGRQVVGFDCAHYCDLTPWTENAITLLGERNVIIDAHLKNNLGQTYKTWEFVLDELKDLVKQIKETTEKQCTKTKTEKK